MSDKANPPGSSARIAAPGDPFAGGGEAGTILRSIDWNQRRIGPVENWPQSLRTALSICLSSRHPICIIWGPDRLYFYNDAYTPILGTKHPWALGESYITVWPEIWESSIRPILETVEQTGEASWCDDLLLVLRRHGYDEECYFSFSFAPTRIEDGSVGGVFTAITETTTQVIAERRLRTLRDLGGKVPTATSAEAVCRIAGEVLSANALDVPFALFYLVSEGRHRAEIIENIGVVVDSVAAPRSVELREDGTEDFWRFQEIIKTGRPLVRTLDNPLANFIRGGPWPEPVSEAMVLPIVRPGEAVPFGFVVLGVTPRRPLDGDYRTFLETVVSHVALAVANARAHAEERRRSEALAELDRAKTDFFSNVSHEFRTPLTLMLGPLDDLISGRTSESLTPEVRERLETTHRNSLRLLKLVNNLLDFSRIEAGRLEANFEPVDLPELTAELSAVFRSAVEAAGLRFTTKFAAASEPAYVDRDLWEKIVFNLLSNACKYTHEGGIEVSLVEEPAAFCLQVRDTGIGIAQEDQADIFKRFHRVKHARGRTHEGSGIGLSLVQELVRLHNGTVEVQSVPDEGSVFSVRIPKGRAHVPEGTTSAKARGATEVQSAFVEESLPRQQSEEPRKPSDRLLPRILLADDNADMRAHVRHLLDEKYDVMTAADGEAALEILRTWTPQLILADVMMPRLDGFGLIRRLRENPETRLIPVILLSARAGEAARIEGLQAGADDYLTKPFGSRELLARIESHLKLSEVRRVAAEQIVASSARFERLMSIMPAGVIACDSDGAIVFFNQRAEEIWRSKPKLRESYESFAARFRIISATGKPVPLEERAVARALKHGVSWENGEQMMERPDGTRFVARFNVSPTLDSHGTTTGVIVVFQDITEERRAEVRFRETQERYRAVFHQASVGILECDLRGKIVRTNPALSRIVGFSPEELLQKNWRDLTHPDELAADEAVVGRLLRCEVESIGTERRYARKDGSYGWVDIFATLIRDSGGVPVYGLAMVVDISERKRAEAELRETERRFRVAADSAPVLIWTTDDQKRCTWVNRPWLEFVNRPMEDVVGKNWTTDLHAEDRHRCLDIYDRAAERREKFSMEYRLRRYDGEYRWLLAHGVPREQDGEFIGYIGSCVDITDRRAAEEAMNESRNAERARRQELEVLTQVAPAGIWMSLDPECHEIVGNAAAHAMLRIPFGQNLSRSGAAAASPSSAVIMQNGAPIPVDELAMRVAGRTGKPVLNQELEFRFPDGSSTWVYGSATPLKDENGNVRGVICVMLDVTERKRAEAALRFSEEQLRLVTDHTSVMIVRVDRDHRYRFVNRTYAARYGRHVDELVGRRLVEIVGAATYETSRPHLERALTGKSTQFELFYPDLKSWGEVVYEPERAADGTILGVIAVIVDITRRKEAEIEMKRARDEAVAASRAKDDFLAALSHELRTPLSPVLLLASEAAEDESLEPAVRKDFETIRKSVELEARLIDDLLDLTRITRDKLVLEQQAVDLSGIAQDALATVAADFAAKHIEVSLEIGPGPKWVWGDAVRLQQVFWNVLKNAVKFTSPFGKVTIHGSGDEATRRVVFTVTDSGIGITPDELARVFEAFAQGDHAAPGGSHRFGGLGLGLAISRRVVELHQGTIHATSLGRNHGATFRLELPMIERSQMDDLETPILENSAESEADTSIACPAAPTANLVGLSGRILLVEDHSPTRHALEQLLVRRKYSVRAASTAGEARALARQEVFDLVISDIGLPDGTGYDLMKELKARYGIPGISLTGYGMEEDVLKSRAAGFVQHLTKPVRMQLLEAALTAAQTTFPGK
jgi:PAS domain S-box-containing protein